MDSVTWQSWNLAACSRLVGVHLLNLWTLQKFGTVRSSLGRFPTRNKVMHHSAHSCSRVPIPPHTQTKPKALTCPGPLSLLWDHPLPLTLPLPLSNNTRRPVYSPRRSLPPPALWTQAVVTECFFRAECGPLVNSWSTIHREAKSSQDTAAVHNQAATKATQHEYWATIAGKVKALDSVHSERR